MPASDEVQPRWAVQLRVTNTVGDAAEAIAEIRALSHLSPVVVPTDDGWLVRAHVLSRTGHDAAAYAAELVERVTRGAVSVEVLETTPTEDDPPRVWP